MIPLVLVGLFATGVWLAHEAWTTPVSPESDQTGSRWRLLEEFLHQAGLHDVTPRDFVLFSVGGGVLVGAAAPTSRPPPSENSMKSRGVTSWRPAWCRNSSSSRQRERGWSDSEMTGGAQASWVSQMPTAKRPTRSNGIT